MVDVAAMLLPPLIIVFVVPSFVSFVSSYFYCYRFVTCYCRCNLAATAVVAAVVVVNAVAVASYSCYRSFGLIVVSYIR